MAILTVGWTIPRKKFPIILVIILLGLSGVLAVYKRQPVFDTIWQIPSVALETDMNNLIKMDLKGRMYNEFAVGGYLLYYLYPKYQIFIDGRADIYSCCEMRDYWKVITAKPLAHQEFAKVLKEFVEKYNFSYMILPTYSFNPMDDKARMMTSTVLEDAQWRMVYFSDLIQVLVKDDGKNSEWFAKGVKVVTPYSLSQYPRGKEVQARLEYEEMAKLVDSGVTRTALGNLDLLDKNLDKARVNFETATKYAPMLGRAWVGLATVNISDGKHGDAVNDLKKAIEISPYLGEAYLKLANIYILQEKPDEARTVLEKGLKQNIDFMSLREMAKLLNSVGSE
jgi:tetratricopeptide (TPR) repeat protein